MDDLSLRVYLENAADADRGGWLELPVAPERLDAFMRGVVGVAEGDGYAVVDHEPGWFGDVLGSDLESFSVSSLNLAARCVAHARDLAVADSVDGDVFLDMLATAAESEDVRFPSGIATLAARAGDVAEFWTEYSLPDSWRAGNSSPDELYGAHVAYGLMGDDAYSSLSYCMDLERLGRDEASNAGVTPGGVGLRVRSRAAGAFRSGSGRDARRVGGVRLRVEAAVRGVPPVRHRRHRVRGRDRGRLHVGGRRDELGRSGLPVRRG